MGDFTSLCSEQVILGLAFHKVDEVTDLSSVKEVTAIIGAVGCYLATTSQPPNPNQVTLSF